MASFSCIKKNAKLWNLRYIEVLQTPKVYWNDFSSHCLVFCSPVRVQRKERKYSCFSYEGHPIRFLRHLALLHSTAVACTFANFVPVKSEWIELKKTFLKNTDFLWFLFPIFWNRGLVSLERITSLCDRKTKKDSILVLRCLFSLWIILFSFIFQTSHPAHEGRWWCGCPLLCFFRRRGQGIEVQRMKNVLLLYRQECFNRK